MLTTDLKTRLRALARRRHRPMAKPDRLATMAMTTLQTLYDATGGRLEWRDIDQVVLQPEHFEALEYAVGQHWVEVSALFDAVRLTAEGRRVLIRWRPARADSAIIGAKRRVMFGLPVGIAGGDFDHGLYLRSPVTVLDLACRSLRPEERDEWLGRPRTNEKTEQAIRKAIAKGGMGKHKIARALGVGSGTVARIKAEMATEAD